MVSTPIALSMAASQMVSGLPVDGIGHDGAAILQPGVRLRPPAGEAGTEQKLHLPVGVAEGHAGAETVERERRRLRSDRRRRRECRRRQAQRQRAASRPGWSGLPDVGRLQALGPSTMSNSTASPSASERNPST